MERSKAVQIAKALESIESFEVFADEIENIVKNWDDCFVASDFVSQLFALMDAELNRRKEILEKL